MKQDSTFDFNFTRPKVSGIAMDHRGCTLSSIEANKVRLADLEPGYSFAVTGFDVNRDLTIRATPRRLS